MTTDGAGIAIPDFLVKPWPYRYIFADDFNASTLSPLFGLGMAGQAFGNAGNTAGAAAWEKQIYTRDSVSFGNSCLILSASPVPGGLAGAGVSGKPAIVYYKSGAVSTTPGSGAGYAPSTGGLAMRLDLNSFIFQVKIWLPGLAVNGDDSMWAGMWVTGFPNWTFEIDFIEQVANALRAIATTTHYNKENNGGGCDDETPSTPWANPGGTAWGTWLTCTFVTTPNSSGAVAVLGYLQGVQVASNAPMPAQKTNMGLILNYGLTSNPGAGWPGDKMMVDYLLIGVPSSSAVGQGYTGGGVAPGTLLPGTGVVNLSTSSSDTGTGVDVFVGPWVDLSDTEAGTGADQNPAPSAGSVSVPPTPQEVWSGILTTQNGSTLTVENAIFTPTPDISDAVISPSEATT